MEGDFLFNLKFKITRITYFGVLEIYKNTNSYVKINF